MTASELRNLLNEPHKPGLEFIERHQVYETEILNGYRMEVSKYNNILDKFCPPKLGQLTVIIGHNNVGKTTLAIYLLSRLALQKRKILIYSAENRISTIHEDFTRFMFGTVNKDSLEATRESVAYIKNSMRFTYMDILNQSTYLLDAGFDWDFFLIDPYNALKIQNPQRLNMHDYHYEVADTFRLFSMNTGKSLFLNCHTLTESQREKYDANGERKAPLASMTEGGAKWINKADDVMVFHRNPRSIIDGNKYITEVHVEKIRNKKFGGEPTPFDQPLLAKFTPYSFDFIGEQRVVNNYYEKPF